MNNQTFCGKAVKQGLFRLVPGYHIKPGYSTILSDAKAKYVYTTSVVVDKLEGEHIILVATANSIYMVEKV